MKKIVFFASVAMLVMGLAGSAFAASPPSVIDPATGMSNWTYKDLHDADPKYEGGYARFDDTSTAMYTTNPHGGYATTTNKCKVCHAAHRAEGAYYLLRADSQDDACSYCHVGSAHSSKVVYDLNPDGIYTMNGHTIGAFTQIPDSSVRQYANAVTLSSTDASGNPVSEVIEVRSYDPAKNSMYRLARHHGQSAVSESWTETTATPVIVDPTDGVTKKVSSSARGGYIKVGPLALRCMSCHQPHNAVGEVWRPRDFTAFNSSNYSTSVDGAFRASGYKLLRRYPSATTTGTPWTTSSSGGDTFYQAQQVVKAIEDSAVAGRNFSQASSSEFSYVENGVRRAMPTWIAQDIHAPASGDDTGIYRYPNKVNNMALSWWCADCHNLNIGGWEPLTDPELGFKAHTERTHPSPYYGAYTGPAQCYSCHRNDLAPQMGRPGPSDTTTRSASIYAGRESCTQCHYGTGDYYQERVSGGTRVGGVYPSDFPHSGKTTDVKMLGSYSVVDSDGDPSVGSWTPVYSETTITDSNLDAVCLRCHPGIGFNH